MWVPSPGWGMEQTLKEEVAEHQYSPLSAPRLWINVTDHITLLRPCLPHHDGLYPEQVPCVL